MNLDSLLIYVKVVEKKNFSKAAEDLALSQPAVSQHIRMLEELYGTTFLIRSPKQVQVTKEGMLFYQKAKQILHMFDETRMELQMMKQEVSGMLHVGASYTIGEYYLPYQLVSYSREYPLVQVNMEIANTEQIVDLVRDEKVDIGLIEGKHECSEVEEWVFKKDEMVLLVQKDHLLARKQLIQANDLCNQTWILREKGSGTRWHCDLILSELDIIPVRYYELSSNQAVKEAVMAGLGVAIVSELIAKREVLLGECRAIKLDSSQHTRLFSLITKKNKVRSRACQLFLDMILLNSST
ncbi:LysR family transcriptional regulator [Brevibacillus daliensis]|uniref:LysR family transcriptional regulator n=1 Tax=Brevibacillus daliensis TaxID=2892995 RepID=UPI001E559E9D|nr:LysR family transcriptional regulator [Brevibacillus daliensis]